MGDLSGTELSIGPFSRADASYADAFRVGEDGALIVGDGHGRFGELAARQQVYTAFTALAGTTLVANNAAPPAAGVATVLSVLNPVGSGMDLEILQGWVFHISATTGEVGFWCWCGATPGVAITTAEAGATKRPLYVGQAVPLFKAWSQTVLAGSTVHTNVRPFPSTAFAAAIAATTWARSYIVDNVDGAIVVPQGAMITLAPPAAGSAVVVGAGIVLAQVPRPEP